MLSAGATAVCYESLPEGEDGFAGAFSPIDFSGGVVVAISGGSDSTALLLLLKQHLDRIAPDTRLLAVTVDHRLRPESAIEAEAVARFCAENGISHRSMAWDGEKPASGLAAAAREARYRLLAKAARDAGLGMIVTGHTADDQAETVLMRSTRADGRGLAGMAPATLHEGSVWIVRPLLALPRETLRAWLHKAGVGWFDDPGNSNAAYERPRIRASLSRDHDGKAEALALAARAGRERDDLGCRAAALIGSLATTPSPGLIRLDRAFADAAEQPAAVYALRILLAAVGGTPFLADEARAAALLKRLAAGNLRATLSRTVVDRRGAGIFLHRELRGLPEPARLENGAIWDGRWRVENGVDGSLIAPFGREQAKAHARAETLPGSLVRAALAAQPAILAADDPESPPVLAAKAGLGHAVAAPWARFLPSFDLAPARAVAELIGAPAVPSPPLAPR